MSNEYEVVPKEEVPNKFNEIPSDWLKSYVGTNYVFLRPVSLPVQDGVIKGAWEDGWQAAFDAVKQGWQSCSIGHDLPQTLLKNFLSKQPTPTVTTQGEGIIEAAKDLLDSKFWQYKAGNGRMISIEDGSGEKCWIVPDEKIQRLEDAINRPASLPAAGGPGDTTNNLK